MADQPLNLDALAVLDSIDREGSFAAAAAALHRVPSAITYAVRNLEADLGVDLFDRSGHRAILTEHGRVILERARTLLAASDGLRATARQLASGWESQLTIAVDSLIDIDRVLPMVSEFHDHQPDVEIRLTEEVLNGHWDALTTERADLVIGAPGQPVRGVVAIPFGPPDWIFVAAPEHPATHLVAPLDASMLATLTAVMVSDSARSGPRRTTGSIGPGRRLKVPHLDWKLAAHCAGLGVGWVPRHRVAAALADNRLVELELEEARPPEALNVAWRRGPSGRALSWFSERLRAMNLDVQLLSPS